MISEKIFNLNRCKVYLCENNRDIKKWPFCPACMQASVRRVMALPMTGEIKPSEEQLAQANVWIEYFIANWKQITENDKQLVKRKGLSYADKHIADKPLELPKDK